MWQHIDSEEVLKSQSIEGVRARRHEESMRRSLQALLSIQARRWAHEARFWELEGLVTERHAARKLQHDFVHTLKLSDAFSGAGRSFSKTRSLTPDQSSAISEAGRKLHDEIYRSIDARESAHRLILARLSLADDVIEEWEDGDGFLRMQDRGDSPDLYRDTP